MFDVGGDVTYLFLAISEVMRLAAITARQIDAVIVVGRRPLPQL